jgi:hypothetical protein
LGSEPGFCRFFAKIDQQIRIVGMAFTRQRTAPKRKVGRVGHEHPPLTPSKTPISTGSGAKSDARPAPKPIQDPDLVKVVEAWPELPEHIKAAIKALIRTHVEGTK